MEMWRLATCGHGLHRSSLFGACNAGMPSGLKREVDKYAESNGRVDTGPLLYGAWREENCEQV